MLNKDIMVTTVTLNPMLDKTIYLNEFEKGKIWRSKKIRECSRRERYQCLYTIKNPWY